MRLGLLGTVEAVVGGVAVNLGHARQRAVLAALSFEPNTPQPAHLLVTRVWGHEAPLSARNTLYGYLHHLRRALDPIPGVDIIRIHGGYTLTADKSMIDLHRFRRLVAQADAAEDDRAWHLLEQALGLWRAEALTGVESPWIDTQRHVLNHERTAARLHRNDLGLRLGRHRTLLAELADQVPDHPFDEHLAAQYIQTLYLCGRRADALDYYEQIRSTLSDELGIDPGQRLRRVHHQVLVGRATSHPPAPGSEDPHSAQMILEES